MVHIQIILFDIGGVLVEYRGITALQEWTNYTLSIEELWEAWLSSSAVRAFETGNSTQNQFAHDLIEEMNLPVNPNELLKAFILWPRNLYPGAKNLLERCRKSYFLASLSNTNSLHWQKLSEEFDLTAMFDRNFPSHLVGKLKPDIETFEYVFQELKSEPSDILFIDDNEINVKAAKSVGMEAYCAIGPQKVECYLEKIGILDPSR